MYFRYTPEDGEAQEWWFEPQKMRAQEAEAIEKRTGWDWGEFGMHLQQGSVLARRALLWTYLRRVHHVLRFEDVDFATGEIVLEYTRQELEELRVEAEKKAAPADLLARLDLEMAEAREAPGKAT